MPKKIGQLVGATKIHEIIFEGDKIKKKNMPNEYFYQPVKIKLGDRLSGRGDPRIKEERI